VDFGVVTKVSEELATSVFKVEVSRAGMFVYIGKVEGEGRGIQ
jgi:hypothetical protein